MSTYRRAWIAIVSTFGALLAILAGAGILMLWVGRGVLIGGFFLMIPVSIVGQLWVRCPVCRASPYQFGWRGTWSKPWPNRRCYKCKTDLRSI